MITDSQLDAAVFGCLANANGRWRKVAMVIGQAADAVDANFPADQAGHELIARRIVSLVEAGRLVAQGDITRWRHGEIRVP